MKLVADESVDLSIVKQLCLDGHEVAYIAEFSSGISDVDVLEEANKKARCFIVDCR